MLLWKFFIFSIINVFFRSLSDATIENLDDRNNNIFLESGNLMPHCYFNSSNEQRESFRVCLVGGTRLKDKKK